MINKILEAFAYLVSALFILFIAYVSFEYSSYKNVFLEQRDKTRVQFEEANEALLAEIPPPKGVEEIWKYSSSDGYGVWLTLSYRIRGIRREDAVKYYKSRLLERGFLLDGLYVRGTACISTDVNLKSDEFSVIIWYDYRKQSFSPRVPPDWLVYFVGYGEKKVLTCPNTFVN